jgi:hypothetical protein
MSSIFAALSPSLLRRLRLLAMTAGWGGFNHSATGEARA